MSGMKNLANAIANDPSFAKQAGMTAAEAKQFVGTGGKDDPQPKGARPSAPPKPRSY